MEFELQPEIYTDDNGRKFKHIIDDDGEYIGNFYVDELTIELFDEPLQEEVVEEAVEDAAEYGLNRFGLAKFISAEAVSHFVTNYIFKGFKVLFGFIKGFLSK